MGGSSWEGEDRRVGPNVKQLNAVGGPWVGVCASTAT